MGSSTLSKSAETLSAPNIIGSSTIKLKADSSTLSPKSSDSLLDLDFSSPPIARSASAAAASIPSKPSATASMRPDLKSSILALYATPRPRNVMPSPQIPELSIQQQQPTANNSVLQEEDFFGTLTSAPSSESFDSLQFARVSQPDLSNPFADLSISSSSAGVPKLDDPWKNVDNPW